MDKEFLIGLGLEAGTVEAILAEHAAQVAGLQLRHQVELAIGAAGGKNHKAIAALLDVQALQESQDMATATEQALLDVKQQCAYLFDTAPNFPRHTGTPAPAQPMTLAGALREKFRK